jgi:hypothetical protein
MTEAELKDAVVIGRPPKDTSGRSRYGLGLKTGACWFGDLWTVRTKKLGDVVAHAVTVDVKKVASNDLELPHQKQATAPQEHYTILEIRKLHRRISGRTTGKVKNYLRSLYRRDLSSGQLVLKWNGEALSWDADIDKSLLTRRDGSLARMSFRFSVGGKVVKGWAGVLEKGTRSRAGFSIIQANRVIKGWPDSYRPGTIFGNQVGGSNDLVNQRLIGEIELEGFDVSHTKDRIIFGDGEQEALEMKLGEKLAGLRQLALSHRKGADERPRQATDAQREEALSKLETEMESAALRDFLRTFEVPPVTLLRKTNEALLSSVVTRCKASLKATAGKLEVSLYLVKDMSPNDPYVIIESTRSATKVIVIVNLSHPHWAELTNRESITNFIRHCAYDGVAEWKAYSATGSIDPDTVKLIKDNLLRIPLQLHGT